MKTSTKGMLARAWMWGLLALPVTVVVALALTFAANDNGASQAEAQELSVDFSIEVDGGLNDCSTRPGDVTKCNVGLGSQFTVGLNLESFAGFPSNAYAGVQGQLDYSAGLTLNDRPGVAEIVGVWPDCSFEAESIQPPSYYVACAVAIPFADNLSVYTGRMAEVDFTCSAEASQQTVTMVHGGPLGTELGDGNVIAVEAGPDETLTINCIDAPPTPTPAPPTPTPVPFPWDVDNDGFVTIEDVFEVARHFGEAAP